MNKKLTFFFIFITIIILVRLFGVVEWFSLEQLKANRDYLQQFVVNNYLLTVFCYLSLYIAATALFLPIGALLTIASGFLFGTIAGVMYTNIGATGGAVISFLLVRYLIGETIQQKYAVPLARFNTLMQTYGSNYLLMVRFIVIIPFFFVNILAGLTTISLCTFIWTTAVGILPASFIFAFTGHQLTMIESVQDIFSWQMLFALFFLALLAFLPVIFSYRQRKNKGS